MPLATSVHSGVGTGYEHKGFLFSFILFVFNLIDISTEREKVASFLMHRSNELPAVALEKKPG